MTYRNLLESDWDTQDETTCEVSRCADVRADAQMNLESVTKRWDDWFDSASVSEDFMSARIQDDGQLMGGL